MCTKCLHCTRGVGHAGRCRLSSSCSHHATWYAVLPAWQVHRKDSRLWPAHPLTSCETSNAKARPTTTCLHTDSVGPGGEAQLTQTAAHAPRVRHWLGHVAIGGPVQQHSTSNVPGPAKSLVQCLLDHLGALLRICGVPLPAPTHGSKGRWVLKGWRDAPPMAARAGGCWRVWGDAPPWRMHSTAAVGSGAPAGCAIGVLAGAIAVLLPMPLVSHCHATWPQHQPHTAVTQMSTTSVFTSAVQSDCTTSGYLAMLLAWRRESGRRAGGLHACWRSECVANCLAAACAAFKATRGNTADRNPQAHR